LSHFVLDASVALSWCFEDEANTYADRILDLLAHGAEAQAPAIWPLEIYNSLLTAERRKRITAAESANWLNKITALKISIGALLNFREAGDILSIAREYGLSMYDASYVELARRAALPLATIDRKLDAAARKSGISTAVKDR
jgi:predicted nucleic acid-binding protein